MARCTAAQGPCLGKRPQGLGILWLEGLGGSRRQLAAKEERGRVWRELPAASRGSGSGSGVSPEQVDVAESRSRWSERMSEAMSS